jgi:hypothetical protein
MHPVALHRHGSPVNLNAYLLPPSLVCKGQHAAHPYLLARSKTLEAAAGPTRPLSGSADMYLKLLPVHQRSVKGYFKRQQTVPIQKPPPTGIQADYHF